MAAPDYVPVLPQDRPRDPERLPPPARWRATRPGDFVEQKALQPTGPTLGYQGPDLGYALKLAEDFQARLKLGPAENAHDAVGGIIGIAMRRASMYGRAPVIYDLEVAFGMWGYLTDDPPADLAAYRRHLVQAIAHDYARRREIADRVPEATLRMAPAQVLERVADWRPLTGTPAA